jgi:hypothetical protein
MEDGSAEEDRMVGWEVSRVEKGRKRRSWSVFYFNTKGMMALDAGCNSREAGLEMDLEHYKSRC